MTVFERPSPESSDYPQLIPLGQVSVPLEPILDPFQPFTFPYRLPLTPCHYYGVAACLSQATIAAKFLVVSGLRQYCKPDFKSTLQLSKGVQTTATEAFYGGSSDFQWLNYNASDEVRNAVNCGFAFRSPAGTPRIRSDKVQIKRMSTSYGIGSLSEQSSEIARPGNLHVNTGPKSSSGLIANTFEVYDLGVSLLRKMTVGVRLIAEIRAVKALW